MKITTTTQTKIGKREITVDYNLGKDLSETLDLFDENIIHANFVQQCKSSLRT
jgi:hypothetical protein